MSTTSGITRAAETSGLASSEGSRGTYRGATSSRFDAFCGFIMAILISNGFGLISLADNPHYAWLGRQFDHVPWKGMVFWGSDSALVPCSWSPWRCPFPLLTGRKRRKLRPSVRPCAVSLFHAHVD